MAKSYDDHNVTLVPNGIDKQQFRYEIRQRQSIPTVGFLYGIVNWKGAETAFKAISRAKKILPELRVICFGAHPIESKTDIPRDFQYYFRPDQNFTPDIYKSVDCWVLPSTTEGFGMPGLEAAACGCPIVSTRCGGPEDYVNEGENGYLVNVGDEEDMADKLLKVLNLDDKAWAEMSRKSAEIASNFDWDRSAEILEKSLYEELAKN